jgi:hypothetical protein
MHSLLADTVRWIQLSARSNSQLRFNCNQSLRAWMDEFSDENREIQTATSGFMFPQTDQTKYDKLIFSTW